MIIKNGREIVEYYYGKVPLMEVYRGKYLIWQAIRSCFGNGYWVNEKPWSNTDVWKNN